MWRKNKDKLLTEEDFYTEYGEEEDNGIYDLYEEEPRYKKVIRTIILIIIALIIMIITDIVFITRYDKGPYFAIRTKVHKDGTEEFYGFGYKVIKYNQGNKQELKLGTWSMTYTNDK